MDQDAPDSIIQAALTTWCALVGADGAAVILTAPPTAEVVHAVGADPSRWLGPARRTMPVPGAGMMVAGPAGEHGMQWPLTVPPARDATLLTWRLSGAPGWTAAEAGLARVTAAMLMVMLQHSPGGSGLDRLTGLPNRTYFLDETDRHIERLVRERIPGTLMVIEPDGMAAFTAEHGAAARDWVLIRLGGLLRDMVRPTDLVGRVGAARFAVWLDGVDHLVAAERAAALCARRLIVPEAPDRPAVPVPGLSVGIASHPLTGEEDARGLLVQAQRAAALAGRAGGGWRVWQDPD